ncbi:hypothetical protein JTB14_006575 [Gonioctena quinquepunctata]|nr:hypothetical protein JTB14_006575 [Gonioctena quinquepunctata]
MENFYGIGVANRYALFLDDESDPLETLSLKERETDSKKKSKVAEKENRVKTETSTKAKPAPVPKKIIRDTSNRVPENKKDETRTVQKPIVDGKPDREKSSNNREERNNRRNREDKPFNGQFENRDREERPRREPTGENFETRNRERGERRDGRALGNKPGGLRGPRKTFDDRRGKREFDRQSGSDKTHGYRGVKPIEKRDGAGAHNWGSHKDVIEEADRPDNDTSQNWGDEIKVEAPVDAEKKEETEATPVEEEPKELTLDEWKAQRSFRTKPQYNIRKAGEGEDPSQWKKMFELRKKEKEEESEEEEYDVSEYPQRVGRQKHLLEIDIQFNDSRRPGGGRGRGQRSGPRGNRGGSRGGGAGGGVGRDGARDVGREAGREGGIRDGGREGIRDSGRDGGRDSGRDIGRDGQVEDKNDENRPAPKVDDERDFPSLG